METPIWQLPTILITQCAFAVTDSMTMMSRWRGRKSGAAVIFATQILRLREDRAVEGLC